MPRPKWMTDKDYKQYEKCLKDLKNKKGINRYAVCMASIKKRRRRRKRNKSWLKGQLAK